MQRAGLALALAMLVAASARADDDPNNATEYVVKPGDTLGGIAKRVEVPRVLIIEANGLEAPYVVRIGQKLVIPRRRTHVVKEDETGLSIALDYGVPWSAIAAANGIDPKQPIKTGQKLVIPTIAKPPQPVVTTPPSSVSTGMAPDPGPAPGAPKTLVQPPSRFAWPVKGKILRAFAARSGDKAFHDGIDIKADKGTATRAAAAGTVIFAAQGPKEYGLTVIVHHGGRWTTTYSFLDKITVKDGDKVKAGERVGLVGKTGLATEPQLHFEVRRNRVALDPVKYLPDAD